MKTLYEKLAETMFEIDPAKTSCKENQMFDEYDSFASFVEDDLESSSTSLENAIKLNYIFLFGRPMSDENYEAVINYMDSL